MKKIEGFDKVSEVGQRKNLVPGAYICKINSVVDNSAREYLEIVFDIVDGEYKGYFTAIKDATGKDYGRAFRSYKDSALPYFKAFITAVEKSNKGFTWNWNEQELVNKFVVVVFGEEEYDDGVSNQVKVNVKPQEFRSGEALREGKIKIPERKTLTDEQRKAVITRAGADTASSKNLERIEIADEDLPF